MKNKIGTSLICLSMFLLLSVHEANSVNFEPLYTGQDCETVAIQLYDYYIHSEIDQITAFEVAYEEYLECLSQN